MNEMQASKWSKTRAMGKAKYVMYFGVLSWGLPLAALFTLMEWLTQGTVSTSWVYIRIIVMAIIGFFIANFRWEAREKKLEMFHQPKKSQAKAKL
ncbi:hypothetical protein GCM10023310_46840 [Paenibacillus vulneris]|uniref:Uncharacterized protein n=1 Tax=Paenibacillus vulneris TaxID=1133364 RepID=A0ABW3UEF5_9BACL|nr:hypothetical protein [Paenibacillus sp. 32352]